MARSSGRRAAITANPAAICRRSATRRWPAPMAAGGRYRDSEQADGTASATRAAAVSTAARAPIPAATPAARAGPARLAALKVSASRAEPRSSSRPVTTRGSCAVQPPVTAGLNSPASSAIAASAGIGSRPTAAWTATMPSA